MRNQYTWSTITLLVKEIKRHSNWEEIEKTVHPFACDMYNVDHRFKENYISVPWALETYKVPAIDRELKWYF